MFKKTVPLLCCLMLFCTEKVTEKNVAVIVNGKKITREQVQQAAEMIHQSMISAFPEEALKGISPELFKGAARQLIANELMINEAEKRKLKFDTLMVDSVFMRFKSQFSDQASMELELTKAGQTPEGIRREMEKGAMLDNLMKVLLEGIDSIGDDECRKFYAENKSRYKGKPRYRASQIFFPSDTADKKKMAVAQSAAQKVLDQLRADKDFGVLASKYSKGPGADSKGDIGWFNHGDLKPDLEQVLDKMNVGETSDLVLTEAGVHILRKTDQDSGSILQFEEVKDHIRMMLDLKKRNTVITDFIDSLIKTTNVKYIDTSLIPVAAVNSIE